MSVERYVATPGSDAGLDDAWELKERLRREDGIFQQKRRFFQRSYRDGTVYRYHDTDADQLVGFAVARNDGYVTFLAVTPEYRGRGFGRRLIETVAADRPTVTCHVRATNEAAIDFYDHVGFETVRRESTYYRDGTDAYYLRR